MEKETFKGNPLSISMCMTPSMYPGVVGQKTDPKEIYNNNNEYLGHLSNGEEKTYKNNGSLSIISLHLFQKYLYIPFSLALP